MSTVGSSDTIQTRLSASDSPPVGPLEPVTKGGPGPLTGRQKNWPESMKNDWRSWKSGPKTKDQQCHVLGPKISPHTIPGPQEPEGSEVSRVT